ncbi:MAG: undecaprenyl-phosphate glucose phosphotransferase [Gammaproteobacteria bacterium]|nr:undecaprenyl-phosphate glucose phosphotransferase [Gammaproteobacteria bacterium]
MTPRSLLKENAGVLEYALRLLDPFLVVLAGIAAYFLRFENVLFPLHYLVAFIAAFLLCFLIFPFFRVYQAQRGASLWAEIQTLFSAWLVVIAGLAVVMFATKTGADFSRQWMGLWAGLGFAALTLFRILLRLGLRHIRRKGFNLRYIVIVGAGSLGREVAQRIKNSPWMGLHITAFYDDDPQLYGRHLEGVEVRGPTNRLAGDLERDAIDQVWIALPLRAEERMKTLLYELRHANVQVRLVPNIYGFQLLHHSITEVAGFPVINLMDSPLSGINAIVKMLEDKILATLILVLTSPLMILIAMGVKLSSPGPVLFKQKRGGLEKDEIRIWKFRSMKVHAEPEGTITQAKPNDPRITPFGAFLRRTSLDELPQFFNVLRGEMSIVGPRPHALEHNEFYKKRIDPYLLRQRVKPGITGWAQINGLRGETGDLEKMEMRVKYDLYYINNWSVWFDLRIIFLSIFQIFKTRNAE